MARGESFDYDYDTGSYGRNPVQVTRYRQNIQRFRDYGAVNAPSGPIAEGRLKEGIRPNNYQYSPPSAGVQPDFYRDSKMRDPNTAPIDANQIYNVMYNRRFFGEDPSKAASAPATPHAGAPGFGGSPAASPAGATPAPAAPTPAGGGRAPRRRRTAPPTPAATTGTTGAVPPPPSTPLVTVPPAYGPITTPPSATPPPAYGTITTPPSATPPPAPTSPLSPPSMTPPPPPSSPLSPPPATTPPAAPTMTPPRTSPTIETSPEVRERQQRAREARARREGGSAPSPTSPMSKQLDDLFDRIRQSPAAQAWKEQSAQTQQQRRSMFPETNRPTPSTSQPVTTPPTNRTTTRPSKKGKSAIGDVGKRLIEENWKEISKGWLD